MDSTLHRCVEEEKIIFNQCLKTIDTIWPHPGIKTHIPGDINFTSLAEDFLVYIIKKSVLFS